MTSSTMTSPSAWRSLHHCSPRSEKKMRAVDEIIALKTKVCRPVSRLWGHRTGRPVGDQFDSLISNVRENPRRSSEMSKSGFFWNDKESRFSLIVKQRFQNIIPGRLWQKTYSKLNEVIEPQRGEVYRAQQGDEQLRRDQQLHEQLLEQNRDLRESSWEKSQWDGRIEAISRVYIWYNFKEKIDRRSRHYPWTHRQDSGVTEWN